MKLREKFIPNTNEQYSIREDGTVWSHYWYHNKAGKIVRLRQLKTQFNKHSQVDTVRILGVCRTIKSLVMQAFYSGQHYTNIIHIDGNPLNCHISNLQYIPTINNTERMRQYRKDHPEYVIKSRIRQRETRAKWSREYKDSLNARKRELHCKKHNLPFSEEDYRSPNYIRVLRLMGILDRYHRMLQNKTYHKQVVNNPERLRELKRLAGKRNRDNLTDSYIANECLGYKVSELHPIYLEEKRNQLKLYRHVNNTRR